MRFNSDKVNGWVRFALYIMAAIFGFGASYAALKTEVNASSVRLNKMETTVSTDHDTIIELKSDVKHIKTGVDELLKMHQTK